MFPTTVCQQTQIHTHTHTVPQILNMMTNQKMKIIIINNRIKYAQFALAHFMFQLSTTRWHQMVSIFFLFYHTSHSEHISHKAFVASWTDYYYFWNDFFPSLFWIIKWCAQNVQISYYSWRLFWVQTGRRSQKICNLISSNEMKMLHQQANNNLSIQMSIKAMLLHPLAADNADGRWMEVKKQHSHHITYYFWYHPNNNL